MKQEELISYAMDFASYLVLKESRINRIILHGSIARGDFNEESDIDLFVDMDKSDKKLEDKFERIKEDYYKTKKFKEWELKGITNELSILVGKLDSNEWKDLKRSIIVTGIVIYGKYKAESDKIHYYTLISFENIKPDKKRVLIFRKLFGFKIGKKNYPGLIEKIKGVKIGKGAILVPIEHSNEIKKYFKEKKLTIKVYDFWSDTKIG